MIDQLKFRWVRNVLIFATFILVTICVLPMSKAELKKTVEDVAELEGKITGEIDKIGELLAELDFLKEKLQTLHERIEEINNKEIDSLEEILNQKTKVLENKVKERLWVLKENEKELQKMSKDIKKWESQDLNNSMDSLYKSLYKIYKDSLYIKLPMLKTGIDSTFFPFDSFAYMKSGSDSVLVPIIRSMSSLKIIIDSSQVTQPCSTSPGD